MNTKRTKNQNSAFILSTLLSIVLILGLYLYCPTFVQQIDGFLNSHNVHMYNWELFHGVFALSVGLIPLFSFIAWKVAGYSNYWKLLLYTSFAFSGFIILCLIPAVYLVNEAITSPEALGSHRRNIDLPSPLFWNLVMVISCFLSFTFLMMHSLWRKGRNLSARNAKQKILDNA